MAPFACAGAGFLFAVLWFDLMFDVQVLLAGARTVPRAVRLGARTDPTEVQYALARSICRDHLLCATAIAAVLTVELGFA